MPIFRGLLYSQLYYKHAPRTCRNFIELSRRGYYDNVKFHRIIKVFGDIYSNARFQFISSYCISRCSQNRYLKQYLTACLITTDAFGVGFYCARRGSHWNRKRWRVHIWVYIFNTFFLSYPKIEITIVYISFHFFGGVLLIILFVSSCIDL